MNNKNYIAEFMEDNGLEVGEEFSIHDSSGFDNCFFCKDYSLSIASEDSFLDGETVLIELLTGQINPIKIKRQEYVEVDNNVPRFTEIEVRDEDNEAWSNRKFLVKLDSQCSYKYMVIGIDSKCVRGFKQARMIKPSEPEFKEGDMIEVSNDWEHWYERKLITMHEGRFICEIPQNEKRPRAWQYARKIEGR